MIRKISAAPFPIHLHLKKQKVLIVGNSKIVTRLLYRLLESQAKITLFADKIDDELKLLAKHKQIFWKSISWHPDLLKSQSLVFALSDSKTLNSKIANAAKKQGIWVYCEHKIAKGSFEIPATLQYGKMIWSLGGEEVLPGLLEYLLNRLRKSLSREYGILLETLASLDPKPSQLASTSKTDLKFHKHVSSWLRLAKKKRLNSLTQSLKKYLR